MEPVIVRGGSQPGDRISMREFSDAFIFLKDEWLDADELLDSIGYPAQATDEFGQHEHHTLTKRIQLLMETLGIDDDKEN